MSKPKIVFDCSFVHPRYELRDPTDKDQVVAKARNSFWINGANKRYWLKEYSTDKWIELIPNKRDCIEI